MSTSSVRRWLLSGICAAAVAAVPLLGGAAAVHACDIVEANAETIVATGEGTTQADNNSFEWE